MRTGCAESAPLVLGASSIDIAMCEKVCSNASVWDGTLGLCVASDFARLVAHSNI